MDAASDPSKKFSHRFLMLKIRFVSIMVTTPFFGVFDSCFQNSHAQRAKWTFLGRPKMSKNRGSNSFVYSCLRPFWTKYFRLKKINYRIRGYSSCDADGSLSIVTFFATLRITLSIFPSFFTVGDNPWQLEVFFILSGVAIHTSRIGLGPFIH